MSRLGVATTFPSLSPLTTALAFGSRCRTACEHQRRPVGLDSGDLPIDLGAGLLEGRLLNLGARWPQRCRPAVQCSQTAIEIYEARSGIDRLHLRTQAGNVSGHASPVQKTIIWYFRSRVGCGLVAISVALLNIAMAQSILASPAFAFVALTAVASGSIFKFPTHHDISSPPQ